MQQLQHGPVPMFAAGDHAMYGRNSVGEAQRQRLCSGKILNVLHCGCNTTSDMCSAQTDIVARHHKRRNGDLPQPFPDLDLDAWVPATCERVCFLGGGRMTGGAMHGLVLLVHVYNNARRQQPN